MDSQAAIAKQADIFLFHAVIQFDVWSNVILLIDRDRSGRIT
jgi:hypothetical protein